LKYLACFVLFFSFLGLLGVPGPVLHATPICDVQDWDPSTGFSPLEGHTVTVTGYATVGLGIFQDQYTSIYITGLGDDVCGVNVFSFERVEGLEVGDTVTVTGLVEEYVSGGGNGSTTELTFSLPSDMTIIGKGDGTPPDPVVMSTGEVGNEFNEGRLVRVSGLVVSAFVGRSFDVDDGTGRIEIYDLAENFYQTDTTWQSLSYGDEVTVTGLVSQSDPDIPYLSSYSIIPRSPAPPYEDVKKKECIPGGTARAQLEISGSIFAPEIGETVTIKYNGPDGGRMQLRVFDAKGRLAATLFDRRSVCGEQTLVWDGRNEVWEALPAGLYLVTLTAEDPSSGSESMETVPVVIGRHLR
jgi:hypothetical protein